ncbi:hypothetical protein B0H16DRAFT_1903738 [Mycena metata]|uniref:Zinc finger PHD-type domain-containing protein n=1 Tax=Mycena metata TaxID=1033252 RepID=A0AAD7DPX7_9AGAR|nr:hypothetical protein B0H16DRAFT_1903738 [Mycena metata]
MSSSLPVSDASGAPVALPVVDDEGFVVCPECSERVNCGPAGINNFVKRHKPGVSQACKTAKAKRDKKPRQDGKLSGWFTQRAPLVRSTVGVPAPIPPVNTPGPPVFPLPPPFINPASVPPRSSNTPQSLLDQFRVAIKTLPATVPEATDSDVLSIFGGDPAQVIDAMVPANEIYEHLNPLFHTALGWNMSMEETAQVLRRGHWGLDGLLRFITYFVTQRGVREQDFGAKIQQILDAINFLTPTAPSGIVTDPTIVPTAAADDEEIEFISHTPAPILSRRCNGFIFPLKQNQTISDAYPIQMHDKGGLPWDFGVRRQVLYLTAHSCTGTRRPGLENCGPCANLANHNMLKGIINRSADGVHENANLLYQPTTALIGITRTKSFVIQNLRLGVLNNSRKLLTQTKSLSDYKRLVVAIGSGDVKRVDRVIAVCVKQKRGIRGMLDAYLRAAKGLWKPANSEEEDMFGLAMLKLAGVRVTEIAHRALGLPGVTTLRNRMITPPLTASPGAPQVEEIQKNIEACFGGIVDALAAKKVVHQIVMFDEIATEKRIRWDPRTNHFLGVCRQHAHHVGLEFNGERDLDELLDALKKKATADGKLDSLVHNAGEVTVAAVGIMSADTRLYSARPILISGDCKRESGVEHSRKVLTPVLRALKGKKELTNLRTICLASDGETRRGTAFMIKTWKHILPSTSSIHKLLKDLKFMNFMVGDDDLTGDKDPKHVHKRLRNGIIRERGIRVLGIDLTPGIIRTHFQSAGHNVDHIRSVFNPEDKQDVRLAFDMLKDIWSLPPCPVGTHPGISAAREALRTLGKLLFHFVSPYICVDYSLSEQLEHLSAAAHLALALFRRDGKHFMASLLYTDIMIIIKNVFFCVAKAKVDDPLGKFWLILLGTDRLEELFGILRTMIGNDANCDVLQILDRLRGTTEVSTILTKYPHWDRAPRRLRLPAMTRDCTILPDKVDHIKPASVRGDMRVQEVTPLTCWKRGRDLVELECPWAAEILRNLDAIQEINILAPHGKDSFADLDPDDNEDEEIEATTEPAPPPHPLSVELEEAAEDELHTLDIPTPLRTPAAISHSITVDGQQVRKAKALSQRLKYGNKKVSTDRNRRVAGIARHGDSTEADSGIAEFDSIFGGPCLMISDVIATLVGCEDRLFLCLGEVNGIYLNSQSLDSIGLDVLPEQTVHVSFQFLKIIPATTIDDPSSKHDWKSAGSLGHTLKVPGKMVQCLDPTLSTARIGHPYYLFESSALRILTASLFEQLTPQKRLLVPSVNSSKFYPYREGAGRACFVCERDNNSRDFDVPHTCPVCPPNTPLDPAQPQQVLAHNAAHILFDPKIDRSTEPCGICLSPAPACEFYVSATGKAKVISARTKCPNSAMHFRYSTAVKSTESAPSSNVPLNCTLCPTASLAPWRYNFLHHLQSLHPTAPADKYATIWELDSDEVKRLKKVWENITRGVPIPKKREPKRTALVLSEAHNSRLSMRETVVHFTDLEGPAPMDESDDEDTSPAPLMQQFEAPQSAAGEKSVTPLGPLDEHVAGNIDSERTHQAFDELAESSFPFIDTETLPFLDDAPTPPPADQLITPVSPAVVEFGRGKRKRLPQNLKALEQCLCGNPVSEDDTEKIKCNRNGCETVWYHLSCVGMEDSVHYWTCEACASSAGGSRPLKRTRRV